MLVSSAVKAAWRRGRPGLSLSLGYLAVHHEHIAYFFFFFKVQETISQLNRRLLTAPCLVPASFISHATPCALLNYKDM